MTKKRKFVIVHVGHATDIVWCDRLRPIVEECGLEMEALNDSDDDFIERFNRTVCQNLDEIAALGSTNQYMFKYKVSGDQYLHQFCKLPIIVQSMDNPALLMPEATKDDDNVICMFNSQSHETLWKKYMGGKGKTFVDGIYPQTNFADAGDLTYEAYAARQPKALLAVNMHHMDETLEMLWNKIREWPDENNLVAVTAVDFMATAENMGALEAVETAMEFHCWELNTETLVEIVSWVEAVVKVWRREYVLRALIESPITISTPHTPAFFWLRHRDKFVNTIGPETIALGPKFRATINISPPFPGCIHDRVINSIEAGALLISDTGTGIERILTPGKDFVPYKFTDKNLPEVLEYYLNNPRESYEMVISARAAWAASEVPGSGFKQALEYAIDLRDSRNAAGQAAASA
ncbi:MAG: glycosyltransferase family 1 protein [Alphaproteobacteria bacterium]|nr:glycosyltransferase family 1 protein [Alphaproteobacteria bacterium]MBL6951194.1 glycosyltransferase family 1 protein [Alphaproteobacteria bacterium]